MAKFCTQCGKALGDGEICSCMQGDLMQNPENEPQFQSGQPQFQSGQPQYQGSEPQFQSGQPQYQGSEPQFQSGQSQFQGETSKQGNYQSGQATAQMQQMAGAVMGQGRNVFKQMIDLFRNPMTTIKKTAASEDMATAMLMVVSNIIVVFVITLIAMLAVNSEIGDWIHVPIAKVVLLMVLSATAYDFALAGIMLFTAKIIFKENLTFQNMLSIAGAKVLIDSVFLIVGCILMILSMGLGIGVIILGNIFTIVILIMGFSEVSQLSADKKCYAMIIALLILVVAIYLVYYIAARSMISEVMSYLNYFGNVF